MCNSWIQLIISAEGRNRDGVVQENIYGKPSCLLLKIPMISMKTDKIFENFIPAEKPPAEAERNKDKTK